MKITYTKHAQERGGTKAYKVSFASKDPAEVRRLETYLSDATPDNPKKDALGNVFWVTNLMVEP